MTEKEPTQEQITILENRIARLEKRITILEAENVLLKSTIPIGEEDFK